MSRQMDAIDLIFGLTVNLSNRRFTTWRSYGEYHCVQRSAHLCRHLKL